MSEPFLYFLCWLANSLIIYLAKFFSEGNVVLGTFRFNVSDAAFFSGFWVTALIWALADLTIARHIKIGGRVANLAFYLVASTFSIWAVARFASVTGLGISNYHWALMVGLFVGAAQARLRPLYQRPGSVARRRRKG